jgi:hypothetical protein
MHLVAIGGTTTRPTTPAPPRSPSGSPATPRPDASSAPQLIGARGTEICKRVDTYATALFHQMTVTDMTERAALTKDKA